MTLVHELAFVFLFGALCWSSPTRHSLSKNEVRSCTGPHSHPLDLATDHLDWCDPDLTHRKAQKLNFYIGETPTFMPAVKRCLMYDDLSCYKLVLEHFTEKRLVQGHHLAQMPALAAQLGASKIFRTFGKKESDPLWYHWMTRAVVQSRFDFLKQVAEFLPHPDNADVVDRYPGPPAFYDNLSKHDQITRNILHPSTDQTLENAFTSRDATFKSYYETFYKDWFVTDMVTAQPPIWQEIFDSLKLNNKTNRRNALRTLKQSIVGILSEGVYVIDDIMLSPLNTHSLWEKYVTPQGDEPDDRVDFVMWLIEEGSPISDMVLKMSKWRSGESIFERELQMAVKYASGSVTASLVNQLRINSQDINLNPRGIADVLPAYKEVLHANFSDPMVLKYAKILVETERRNPATEMYRNYVQEFFKTEQERRNRASDFYRNVQEFFGYLRVTKVSNKEIPLS